MSIDELIELLEQRKKESPLGGNTAVYSLEPYEEYIEITEVILEKNQDGAVVLLA